MPTGERNDFGECFFGQVRLVSAARIRLPRKNPGEDVCRGQSSLTFSGTTSKSCARPASVPVADMLNCVRLTRKAAGRLGTDGFVAHTHRLPVGRWVVSRFRDVRFGSKADVAAPRPDVRFPPKSGHWVGLSMSRDRPRPRRGCRPSSPFVVQFLDRPRRREAAGGVNRYCLFLLAGGGVGRIFAQGSFFPASGIFLSSDWYSRSMDLSYSFCSLVREGESFLRCTPGRKGAEPVEAREALVLSVAGVTAIMLTAYLLLVILY
jgi:hypothetical protein